MSEALDLPADVTLDLPRVLLIGALRLFVENHRGLISFAPDRVEIAVAGGELEVAGEGLSIGTVTGEAISIQGRIRALRLDV